MDINSLSDRVGVNHMPWPVLGKSDPGVRWAPLKFGVRGNWCLEARLELSQGLGQCLG